MFQVYNQVNLCTDTHISPPCILSNTGGQIYIKTDAATTEKTEGTNNYHLTVRLEVSPATSL